MYVTNAAIFITPQFLSHIRQHSYAMHSMT